MCLSPFWQGNKPRWPLTYCYKMMEIVLFSELLSPEITGCYPHCSIVEIQTWMAKNTAVAKSGRDASPSRLSQSKPCQNSQFTPQMLPSEGVWFYPSQQIDVTVKPGVLPMKLHITGGWERVGSENPAWKGAPGCKIRASRLQQQHKYSSQAASQIPSTQCWSSDRQKSVFFFIPPHLCISGYFYGMCFCNFFWLPLEFQLNKSHIFR